MSLVSIVLEAQRDLRRRPSYTQKLKEILNREGIVHFYEKSEIPIILACVLYTQTNALSYLVPTTSGVILEHVYTPFSP